MVPSATPTLGVAKGTICGVVALRVQARLMQRFQYKPPIATAKRRQKRKAGHAGGDAKSPPHRPLVDDESTSSFLVEPVGIQWVKRCRVRPF